MVQCSIILHFHHSNNNNTSQFKQKHVSFDRITDFLLDIIITPVIRPEHILQIQNKNNHVVTTSTSSSAATITTPTAQLYGVPPGLSPQRLQRLVGKRIDDESSFIESWSTTAGVERRKLALLNYLPPRGNGILCYFDDFLEGVQEKEEKTTNAKITSPSKTNDGVIINKNDNNGVVAEEEDEDEEEKERDTLASSSNHQQQCEFLSCGISLENILPILIIASVDPIDAVADCALSTLATLRSRFSSQQAAIHVPTFNQSNQHHSNEEGAGEEEEEEEEEEERGGREEDNNNENISIVSTSTQEEEQKGINETKVVTKILNLFLNTCHLQQPSSSSSLSSSKLGSSQKETSSLPIRSPLNWRVKVALLKWVMEDAPNGLIQVAYDSFTSTGTPSTSSTTAAAITKSNINDNNNAAAAAAESESESEKKQGGSETGNISHECLPLKVVEHCLFGTHGSLKLRADGAALAHFLASRILQSKQTINDTVNTISPTLNNNKDKNKDDDYDDAGNHLNEEITDKTNMMMAKRNQQDKYMKMKSREIGLFLMKSALRVLQSANSYDTIDSNTPTAIEMEGQFELAI
eukprot:CAMPEP_0114378396 /NCGR_PEP_ID=MMETSP0102-20121206/1601_1 /TAXON_ID=38822 ORGANISM="Pteridomonas danica, Strain PT" /NCGR_SAMPLE_ID=MMETSP0102 /ASSEMBLY_ACC=CAM_ASM_000212 /LENGTH=579 /DNA_ID=CAMNT_0001533223 /DNA_START=428 /DNA_END=2168 /DNA_ORIENTATION=-